MKYLFLVLSIIFFKKIYTQKDCQIPSRNYEPLTDLTNQFRGFYGGKYSNGNNQLTGNYLNDALALSALIKPLDENGSLSNQGKIVMVSIGASNPRTEFAAFQRQYDTFSNKNPYLVLANTCIGGQGVQKMNNSSDNYWIQAQKTFDSIGVDFNQVQIAWVETDNTQDGDTLFPRAPLNLIQDLRQLLITLKLKFPNLKLCYFSARAYAGWASGGVGKGLSHPRDYYNGWAIKWMIDSAVNQNPNYIYKGNQAKIPMPIYGTYNWTNGEQIRKDGFYINCSLDIGNDGLHLSVNGENKIGDLMFRFFSSDTSSKSWFFKSHDLNISQNSFYNFVTIYPNPSQDGFNIYNFSEIKIDYKIYNMKGQEIFKNQILSNEFSYINSSNWDKGIYIIKSESGYYKKIIIQ